MDAKDGEIKTVEYRMKDSKDRWAWLQSRATVLSRDDKGEPSHLLFSLTDITERKTLQDAISESEEKYKTVVEQGNDGIAVVQDGLLVYANSKLLMMAGYKPEESLGKPFIKFLDPEEISKVSEFYRMRMTGKKCTRRLRDPRHAQGQYRLRC